MPDLGLVRCLLSSLGRTRLPLTRGDALAVPDVLAELNEACHLLGNAKGFAANYDALLTSYRTFSDHLDRAMRGACLSTALCSSKFADVVHGPFAGEETYNPVRCGADAQLSLSPSLLTSASHSTVQPPVYDDADRAHRLSVYGESPPENDVRYGASLSLIQRLSQSLGHS